MAQTLNLANPPAKYRPVPFWSWNEKLDPEVLREQVPNPSAATTAFPRCAR